MNSQDCWKENLRQLNYEISYQPLAADLTKIQREIDAILERGLRIVNEELKKCLTEE